MGKENIIVGNFGQKPSPEKEDSEDANSRLEIGDQSLTYRLLLEAKCHQVAEQQKKFPANKSAQLQKHHGLRLLSDEDF
tara:strand:+ start:96 stop:332 length:237 start_codon:yes stop_codon:yes gene_type:complete